MFSTKIFRLRLLPTLMMCLSFIGMSINTFGIGNNIVLQHFSTRDGLSQNDINCIYQDQRGVVWIGTNNGFSSFDGYEFKNYTMETHPLSSNLINKIKEDHLGNLWLGTADAGLCRFNIQSETFDSFSNTDLNPKLFTDDVASRMTFDNDGNLWFGNSKGLNCVKKEFLDKKHISALKYYHNPHNAESILSNHITDLFVDNSGTLWIGTKKGLQEYIPAKGHQNYGTFKSYLKTTDNNLLNISQEGSNLLIAYFDGVFEMSLKNSEKGDFVKKSDLKCDVLLKSESDVIWAGTPDGLYQLQYGSYRDSLEVLGFYNSSNNDNMSTNIITALYEDNIGIIWIGTNGGGINKYNPRRKKFGHIKKGHFEGSLSYNKIRSIFQDSKDRLWIGTEGGGINLLENWNERNYNSGFKTIPVVNDKKSPNIVYSIEEWNEKMVFGVGYPFKSLAIDSNKAHKLEQQLTKSIFHPKGHHNAAFSIENDGDSVIWMGTYGGGVLRGIKQKDNSIIWSNSILSHKKGKENLLDIIRSLHLDKQGNLWVGTREGLCFISKNEKLKEHPKYTLFQNEDSNPKSLSYNYILPIFEASNGEIWIGTMGGGLNILAPDNISNSSTFDHISIENGLPSNVIKSILEDDYGNLWVASNKGLSKINLETRSVKNYDVSDGLQDDEFSELAAFKNKDGMLLFGGVNGINIFNPHEIVDDNTISDLIFTNLKVLNTNIKPFQVFHNNQILSQSLRDTKSIELYYNQNSFAVNFACLHYGAPENNLYKYKLVGFDQDWISADAMQREAKYTNLSPGEYQLLVKGANGDNVWNPQPISLHIKVLPPWWLSWWAKWMYVMLFFAAISFFSRYSIITARRKSQLEMEKFEREKLEDLSQLKLQFFTNISHELRTPLTLIHTPIEQLIKKGRNLSEHEREKSYQLIFKNVQHLMRLVNQLLDFRKVDQGKMKLQLMRGNWNTFIEQVFHSFKEFAEHEHIDFNFHSEGSDIHGYMDNDKLEKIMYNLLSNAFKFTYQGEINLSVKRADDKVKITLQDTGIGISEEKQEHLFNRFYQVENLKTAKHRGTGIGLAFTKSLVELHNGTIEFESETNKGTTFYLEFPLSVENYEGEQIELNQELVSKEDTNEEEDLLEVSTKPKVVVIDDNHSIRELLQSLLEETYEVFLAEDGEKGLSLAKEVMPNLILSDIMMPILDGYELTKKIREDSQLCHLPIVLLTAKNSENSKLKGYEYGVDAYVTKPFNSDVLLARIHTLIENRSNQQKRFRTDIDIQPSEITFTPIDEKFLNRLVGIVEENISDSEFTVEKLALEYGATPLRLNQKLKALTGQTAKGFIRNIRLKRAAQMLKLGRFSVSDVTYEVGFNDLKYFRNCFKKEFGVPPSHYLKDNSTPSDKPVFELDEIGKE
ncbi:hybrid sensor histidine kinase/response regulator transcription factor [Sediminitomix flava]|uniref:histidine kinase n=1 Tax=Sediminitomix flava TaxID=379075 RepID=A0A315ZSV6_SEDFL|nr:two-component regulator propeller domain-containing protein [Sediminitomix flava]PWJ37940.1 signal transduction histidine kinase [Sediminitomix flava]